MLKVNHFRISCERTGRALNIVTASGDLLSIIGVADIFIKNQGPRGEETDDPVLCDGRAQGQS